MSTYNPYQAYPNFLADKFAEEIFENNEKDPFHLRLKNIRSYRDLGEYFGLGGGLCDEALLKKGFMSQKLHECLELKLGKERLATYFGDGTCPKQPKEHQELEDLATLLWGSVNDVNKLKSNKM